MRIAARSVVSSGRVQNVALLLCCLLLAAIVADRILETPFWSYNGSRLMPTFLLAHGQDPYQLPGSGPMYSTIYGPVIPVAYLPSTLFRTPNAAVIVASAVTVLLCFGAVFALHFANGRWRRRGSLLAFIAAGLFICYIPCLRYSCIRPHADGPAISFAAFACAALYYRYRPSGRVALGVSAVCAVLSVLSKQLMVPVPIALFVYLLVADGWTVAWKYAVALIVSGTVCLGAAMLVFGPRQLFYSLIWLPGHHHASGPILFEIVQSVRMSISMALPVIILLLALSAWWALQTLSFDRLRNWLGANEWTLSMTLFIALIPASISGHVKIGGDINSFSFATFFCVCALTLLLERVAGEIAAPHWQQLANTVAITMVALLMVLEAPLAGNVYHQWKQLPRSEQNVAFEYAKSHRGESYFPWFPLSHLLAEGKFYHYAYGVLDRWMAGEQISQAHFQAYIPHSLRLVGFWACDARINLGYDLLRLLPEFDCHSEAAELPGWDCFFKKSEGKTCTEWRPFVAAGGESTPTCDPNRKD